MHVLSHPFMIIDFIVFTSIHVSCNQPQILGFKLHILKIYHWLLIINMVFNSLRNPWIEMNSKCMLEWLMENHIC